MTASNGTGATDDEIAAVAHQIWESEGRPEGQAERHWFLARERVARGGSDPEPRDDEAATEIAAPPEGDKPDDPAVLPAGDGAETDHTYVRPAGRKTMDLAPSTWSKTDEEVDESFPASDPPGNY